MPMMPMPQRRGRRVHPPQSCPIECFIPSSLRSIKRVGVLPFRHVVPSFHRPLSFVHHSSSALSCFTYVPRDVCHIIRCRCHIGELIRWRSHIADLIQCGTHNSDVETVKCVLGFCYGCPSKKVSQKFLQISVEKMRDFFLFFVLKYRFLGLKPWPDAFLPVKLAVLFYLCT